MVVVEFQLSYFKSQMMTHLKCYIQYASKFGKLSRGHRAGNIQFSFQSQRRTLPKNVNYHTILFISYASKIMLKILQARLQQYVNWEFPDVQAGFRNGRGTRDQIASIRWIMDKTRKFQEKINSDSLTIVKSLCGSQETVENSSRVGDIRPPYGSPEKPICRSRRNS